MDYARCNRRDAEVLVALCAHWRRSPLQEERTPLAEINDASTMRLSASGRRPGLQEAPGRCLRTLGREWVGALKGDAFSLACRGAGLAVPSGGCFM